MRYFILLYLFACSMAVPARGAITPGGVVNAASFSPFGLAGSDIARGSLFVVFGENLGAPGLAEATEFPLPLELAGTSAQVTVGGATADCLVIFTTPNQIALLLPSSTPEGVGELRVAFNGTVSTGPIRVSESTVGIFAQSQAGTGPAIVQNFESSVDTPLNTLLNGARPGQPIIIWATGLGAVTGDEAGGPLPAARPEGVGVRVIIGGRDAQVVDFGRSGCCAGLDQIVAVVPDDVEGCYVAMFVITEKNGVTTTSNSVSLAVGNGGSCRNENGVEPDAVTSNDGRVRYGIVTLGRGRGGVSVPGLGSGVAISDLFSGVFFNLPREQFLGAFPPPQVLGIDPGACFVFRVLDLEGPPLPNDPNLFLDAGPSLGLQAPGGGVTAPRLDNPPLYQTNGVATVEINGEPQPANGSLFLEPGRHTVTGSGGTDVGAFSVSDTLPGLLEWTNSEDKTIAIGEPHTVSWSGAAGASNAVILVSGSSTMTTQFNRQATASFVCYADPAAGFFVIPGYVTGQLPPSDSAFGIPFGTLGVQLQSLGRRFEATGLDFGILTYQVGALETGVQYE